jgi:hypothetical protein
MYLVVVIVCCMNYIVVFCSDLPMPVHLPVPLFCARCNTVGTDPAEYGMVPDGTHLPARLLSRYTCASEGPDGPDKPLSSLLLIL